MLLRTSSSGKTYLSLSCVCFVSCVVVWVVRGVKTFVYQLIVVKTGGLLNINQYIYIFYHIHLSEAQMKQVMLSESIENILGFSRKRVIAICDNIVGIITRFRGWSYNNINFGQESASFLDFKIFGRNNASVCCHSTILMLSLPLMRHLICEESCLVLPDFSLEELKAFIKLLYGRGNRSKQLMVICPVWI